MELPKPFIIFRKSQHLARCYSINTIGPGVFVQAAGLLRTCSGGLCGPVLLTICDSAAQQQQYVVNVILSHLNVNGMIQAMFFCFFGNKTPYF